MLELTGDSSTFSGVYRRPSPFRTSFMVIMPKEDEERGRWERKVMYTWASPSFLLAIICSWLVQWWLVLKQFSKNVWVFKQFWVLKQFSKNFLAHPYSHRSGILQPLDSPLIQQQQQKKSEKSKWWDCLPDSDLRSCHSNWLLAQLNLFIEWCQLVHGTIYVNWKLSKQRKSSSSQSDVKTVIGYLLLDHRGQDLSQKKKRHLWVFLPNSRSQGGDWQALHQISGTR